MQRSLPLLLLLAACAGSGDTVLDLEIQHDAVPQVTDLDVSIFDRTRSLPMQDHVKLVVPDSWAGAECVVEVAGRRGEVVLAHGTGSVVPRLRGTTALSVALVALPCDDVCDEGEVACLGGGVVHCERRAVDGCLAWSAATPCPDATPACSFGECAVACVDECFDGTTECASSGATRTCGQADDDPCLDWLAPEACDAGEACSQGACHETCQDECQGHDTVCASATATKTCGQVDSDSCKDWQAPVACPQGTTCENGECRSTCSNECTAGSTACTGNGKIKTCGQADSDPCTEWLPAEDCDAGEACSGGMCRATCADECVAGNKVCASGSATRTCGQGDTDSCSEWLPATACPAGTTCMDGACVCSNDCTAGTTVCASTGATKTCGQADADTCSEWQAPVTCPTGTTCTGGACVCADECTAGAKECSGTGAVRTCGQADADTCSEWQAPVDCAAGTTCMNGTCVCTDECTAGATMCATTTSVKSCGQADADSCSEWLAPVACPGGGTCTNGVCACTNACTAGATRCSTSGLLETCGDGNGDGCTEWGAGTSCPTGMTCTAGMCS